MRTYIIAILSMFVLMGSAMAIEADTNIRIDPHPDHISFYNNSTYVVCNFTNQEAANVTIVFEKYNTTDNSSDTVADFGEFVNNQTTEFNIATANYTLPGWYRAAMYSLAGDMLCSYEIVIRDNTSVNYEALHGSVRFSDADGVPSVSFVESISGRAQAWTTDSVSTSHSVVLWEYDSAWTSATGGDYEYVDHVNTSADVTNWALSQTYDVNRYYRMILYAHDGEVLDTHCVEAVVPVSNVIEVRAEDVQTGVQIPNFVATIGSETKNSTDGLAYFYNATNGAHVVTVSATNYKDSQKTVYMANSYTNTTVYMLSYSPYAPPHHDVEFILLSIIGTRYSDVNVSVTYIAENEGVATMSGVTDSTGSITFSMVPTIRYTLHFENASQNINKTISICPKNSLYYITASSGGWDGLEGGHSVAKEIHTDATAQVINDTHAYINVTYTDALNDTSNVSVWINQSDPNSPRTPVVIDSDTGTLSTETFIFVVTDYKGEDYKIHIVATHNEFGTIERHHGVHMPGMLVDLNFPPFAYLLISFVVVLFVAGMFSQTNPETGSIVCCVLGWIFLAFGWLETLGMFAALSLTLASVYAVAINISARHRKGGYI